MTADAAGVTTSAEGGAQLPVGKVRRLAFYLASQNQPLFAWLHERETAPSYRHGVIICPPLGYEQIHAHRSLRHLADALAQSGFLVLRVDYHGTGDSAGVDENADRYDTWLTNIRDAMDWMRQQQGCQQTSLIGLRLGATLALQAAARQPVDNLLLWAPVLKGRLYVREMKALSLTAENNPQPLPEAPDDIEAAGFVLTKQTVDDLSRLDLLQTHPQCQRVLIVARDDMPEDKRLLEYLSELSITATQISQPGYADMMAEPHYTKVPRQAIAGIVDWLQAGTPVEKKADDGATPAIAEPAEAFITHQQYTQTAIDSQLRIRERVFRISQQPDLFGILSEPETGSAEMLPLIILLNAGAAYRVGPNRLHVFLARQLAWLGFRSLRMDLCGLGDSVADDLVRENDSYSATMFRDIDLTLKHVQAHLGVKRVVLMGLCSGAYGAFQSAAQIANPVLVESVLINPLTFYWKEGMSLETAPMKQHAVFQYYLNAARQPSKWLKLLSGKSQIGIGGAVKMLVQRWRLRNTSTSLTSLDHCDGNVEGELGHPQQENTPADLQRVAKAGRQLTCFFSRFDPGYSLLMFHARRKVNQLLRAGSLSIYFMDDADHTFSNRVARRTVVQAISEHLCRRYQR